MLNIRNKCLKWLIPTFLVIILKYCDATNEQFQSNLNQLERIKNQLFLTNEDDELRHQHFTSPNDEKCLQELHAIRNGLNNVHFWALKCKFINNYHKNTF